MATKHKPLLPHHTPEVEAALEEVRALLDGVNTSTSEGTAYALRLLRERGLPDSLIYIAGKQPESLSPEAEAWAREVIAAIRARGDVP